MTAPVMRRTVLAMLGAVLAAVGLCPTVTVAAARATTGSSAAPAPPPIGAADFDILCRTVWGEARSEGLPGMRAVCAVILNRRKLPVFPDTVAAICLQPFQFAVWNRNDPNRPKMRRVTGTDPSFILARQACAELVTGTVADPVAGADHYHSGRPPRWARGRKPVAVVGRHRFYKLF